MEEGGRCERQEMVIAYFRGDAHLGVVLMGECWRESISVAWGLLHEVFVIQL